MAESATARRPGRANASAIALRAIQAAAVMVSILAATAGVAYLIVAIAGPEVWWPSGGSNATGAFVEFPLPLRLVNAGAFLAWNATTATVAFFVGGLARRVRHGVLFIPAVTRAAWSLAIALALGTIIAQTLENVGRNSAIVFAYSDPTGDPMVAPIGWGLGWYDLTPNLPLLAVSVVLGLLAYVIGAGERLQRDAEGLV
ncbi:MAG TPA: hypothetical protein VFQ74_02335 [Pseudolysinimonas sp.]|nr:hypothetical protein [Pseudolysinimonas sp.]